MQINSIKDILENSVQDLFEWYRQIYRPVPKASEVVLCNIVAMKFYELDKDRMVQVQKNIAEMKEQ